MEQILTNEFLSKFDTHPPSMSPIGLFTAYRTYSRFLPQEKRRETWKEIITRATDYSMNLEITHRKKNKLPINYDKIR